MIKIGITGGIGSGKSYISDMFIKRGIPVFDSDSEAKSLMVECPYVVSSLKGLLGNDVYIGGEINKPLMASFLFSSKENAGKINSIVHPRVKEEFISWVAEKENEGYGIVAIESAILFESGFNGIVDKTITVDAPFEVRLSRVVKRDNTTKDKVLERMKAQMDETERMEMSDFIIENDGKRNVEEQLDDIFHSLLNKR